jgi:GNAT superfamily N-acetyltransferase
VKLSKWRNLSIVETADPADMPEVRRLFLDYARWFEATFGHDFCFQGFEAELRDLPGVYAPSRGAIWLARTSGIEAVGVIAVKPLAEAGVCEMKRLWIDPEHRATGLGRHLAGLSIAWAKDRGYHTMKLDTLRRMAAAVALYRSLGFDEIDAYVDNPIADVLFLGLAL